LVAASATSAMSRFYLLPREGHLKAVKRLLSYLKTFPKGRVIINISYPDHSVYPVEDHSNWMEIYPDAGEEIPEDFPPEKEEWRFLAQKRRNFNGIFRKITHGHCSN
jgi:hypothetical protein